MTSKYGWSIIRPHPQLKKQQILKIIAPDRVDGNAYLNEDYTEGAGLGLTILLNILQKYSTEQETTEGDLLPGIHKDRFSNFSDPTCLKRRLKKILLLPAP